MNRENNINFKAAPPCSRKKIKLRVETNGRALILGVMPDKKSTIVI